VAWCPRDRSAATARRAFDAGLESFDDLPDLLAACDVVISLCPPAVAEQVAEQVASCSYRGLFVEANAIGPARTEKIAGLVAAAGAEVVDGCVIGPPPGPHDSARLYLSGPSAQRVAGLFAGTRLEPKIIDGPVGQASALKLAFASYNKAAQALAAVSYALADTYGLRAELYAEAQRVSGAALAAPEGLPSAAARAWRWGPEMDEAARTLTEAGLPPEFAQAAAAVFDRWAPAKDDFDLDLDTALTLLRAGPGLTAT
jgi:3-hydroxyisobutyrate dehydrogenase-like beta-hydroxyacid dehydrogenase